MSRVIDLRLRKLERGRRDPDGVFFLAIGRDDSEIEANIAEARSRALLQPGELVVRLKWLGEGMPASRWIVTSWGQSLPGALSKAERAALNAEIDQLIEKKAPHLKAQVVRAGPEPSPMNQWSDEQLIAGILGRPLS